MSACIRRTRKKLAESVDVEHTLNVRVAGSKLTSGAKFLIFILNIINNLK